ncbi:hypothetical protein BDV95DRAFT_608844 [Massariosphaeria phaeospora]|uniref:Uncharacterized protein n=1 Tax=Massariosphaeria phaeospora TaxID=100035 RepID=A0A7C8M5T4_9PLEO|nr:hypothetical protein BDV95DRAFT_608844 [Massariosphaeria phaeospora]
MYGQGKGKEPVRYEIPPEMAPAPGTVSRIVSSLDISVDVTEGLRTFMIDDDPTPPALSPIASPSIIITAPYDLWSKEQRPRQMSSDVPSVQRPKLKRKAVTAPPGAFRLYTTVPHPPRRAISARTACPAYARNRSSRTTPSPMSPRLSHVGSSTTRSLITQRREGRKLIGKTGSKSKKKIRGLSLLPSSRRVQQLSEALDGQRQSSFSEKARVKQTLRDKKVEMLKTNIVDFKSKDLPSTPLSMISTPKELYGTPSIGTSSGTHRSLRPPSPRSRARHFSLPLAPGIQRRSMPRRKSLARKVPAAAKKNVYLPGPICLEEKVSVTPRRGSIATMEHFTEGGGHTANRFSDVVALEGIVMYFHDLGVVEESGEDGLDRYWVPGRETKPKAATHSFVALFKWRVSAGIPSGGTAAVPHASDTDTSEDELAAAVPLEPVDIVSSAWVSQPHKPNSSPVVWI